MNHRIRIVGTACAALALALALLPAASSSAGARSGAVSLTASPQVVLDWNATAVATTIAAGKGQPESALYVGLTQAAVYDAVIAIEGGFAPYLVVPGVPPGSSAEAAAAAAAYGVLVQYFPGQKASLDAAYAASLAGIPDGPAEDRGVLVGRQVATGLVAARIDDGRDAQVPFPPPAAPGVWRPTPPAFLPALHPWMASMKPLLLDEASQFRPGPPPELDSRRYARDFDETRLYGASNSSVRTPEQTETALFWTEFAPQQYHRALRGFISARGQNLREAARSLAMGGTAMADALIACWDGKITYAFWRPVTAIHEAASDGNDRTAADPAWSPLRPTPNHPEYPSAHNCLAGALGETLSQIGGGQIDLDVDSTVTGTTHHFDRVGDFEEEIVNARVWVGFHWRTSDEVGFRLGEHVAKWASRHYFEEARGKDGDD
jgi:hypothetical protein